MQPDITKIMRNVLATVLFGDFLLLCSPTVQSSESDSNRYIEIPFGPPVVIDGAISPGEWDGAGSVQIAVKPGWMVRVFYKHDAANLYFAFEGLKHGGEERYPEVLIASRQQKRNSWESGDLWFHASYNLCEGNGEYGVYYRDTIFQCSRTKPGWSANLFPLAQNQVVEFQISLSKLNANIKAESLVRIAFDVTDTRQKWDLWPPDANLQKPNTWGEALIRAATTTEVSRVSIAVVKIQKQFHPSRNPHGWFLPPRGIEGAGTRVFTERPIG